MSLYEQLREKHPVFIYENYTMGEDFLEFDFRMDDTCFKPRWEFPKALSGGDYDRALVGKIAFSLGLAELVSYWKCACSPTVEIRCGALNEEQKKWWKKLYFNGLGEFFYRNGIDADFRSFMKINCADIPEKPLSGDVPALSGVMVPVGGGKDSVVTIELLKKTGAKIYPYAINPHGAALDCVSAAGIPEKKAVYVKRTIDPELLALNKKGYLNGHTPFSAVTAFSSLLFAVMTGRKYIALSNESSANETYVAGKNINHQYSKSTEFERDFREYCGYFGGFSRCPEYFSLLRPWSEWQIAGEFVKYPQYFKAFKSCNLGSKNNVWCCKCAKCLYVYILLSAFLTDDVLVSIFGCNMLDKTELSDMLDGLILDNTDKPFECVGTKSEVRQSLYMAADLRKEPLPALLQRFRDKFPDYNPIDLSGYFDNNNFVPEEFLRFLREKDE